MGLINRDSKLEQAIGAVDLQQLLKNAGRSVLSGDAEKGIPPLLGSLGAFETGQAVKHTRGAGKVALVLAAGATGVTAASAAISAVRRGHAEG